MECDQRRLFVRNQLSEPQRSRLLQGNPGFVASWRPVYQNRPAVKVVGSPFETFVAAEQACEIMLGHLISDSPSSRRVALRWYLL